MCEFQNGEAIEYYSYDWLKGTYIGKDHPPELGMHVIRNQKGILITRGSEGIRKPKQKKEGWVNIYPGGNPGNVFETKELAIANQAGVVVDVIRIKWEE